MIKIKRFAEYISMEDYENKHPEYARPVNGQLIDITERDPQAYRINYKSIEGVNGWWFGPRNGKDEIVFAITLDDDREFVFDVSTVEKAKEVYDLLNKWIEIGDAIPMNSITPEDFLTDELDI